MTRKIVIYGSGGHGRVVADALLSNCTEQFLGFIDDNLPNGPQSFGLPYPVIGDHTWLFNHRDEVAVGLGIGDNKTRKNIFEFLLKNHIKVITITHKKSAISPYCQLGLGTVVFAHAAINPGAQIGSGAIINTSAVIEHDCQVGDFSHISPSATLTGGVTVGNLSHIGALSVVIPQKMIGSEAIIGAGSVVIKDVPDNVTVVGNPGRILTKTRTQ